MAAGWSLPTRLSTPFLLNGCAFMGMMEMPASRWTGRC